MKKASSKAPVCPRCRSQPRQQRPNGSYRGWCADCQHRWRYATPNERALELCLNALRRLNPEARYKVLDAVKKRLYVCKTLKKEKT